MLLCRNHKSYEKRPDKIAMESSPVPPDLLKFDSLAKSSKRLRKINGKGDPETLVTEPLLLKYDLFIGMGKPVWNPGHGAGRNIVMMLRWARVTGLRERTGCFYNIFSGIRRITQRSGDDIFDDCYREY